MKKSKLVSEFRQFIARGNVIDMAVGIIMGSAFTAIVTSLVGDVAMPLIGKIIGGFNFADLKIVLTPAAGDAAEVAIRYGSFLQSTLNFLLIALVVFFLIRLLNRLHRKKDEPAPKAPQPDPQLELLREIRDLLKK